jgi:O-antigen/teichoic acid export membrane protein
MLINRIKKLSSDKFLSNIGWLGIAEIANRIFRLATTVVLARTFTAYDYGIASIIYTVVDLSFVLTISPGFGAKIIQADEKDLKQACDTTYWLNWLICIGLFLIQCLAAFPIAYAYKKPNLFLPLCAVACTYLLIPFYVIQSTLVQRENRLKVTAIATAIQAILANFITVILALKGVGAWAVIIPIIATTPVWIIVCRHNISWHEPKKITLKNWRSITSFGLKMLGVNVLNRVRMNLDYLLVGSFLGVEALGLYFFAFNAGLGISQSVINAFTSALYPHLCAAREDKQELKKQFFRSLKTVTLIVIPLVTLQSSLAPFYVPIIFGQKWVSGVPILIVICLSAIPIALSRATSQLLQTLDKIQLDFYWNAIFTTIFAISLVIAVKTGIFAVACAVLVTQLIAMPIFTFWVVRHVFADNPKS